MPQKQRTIIHFVRHGEVENPHYLRYGRLPGYHLSAEGRETIHGTVPFFLKRPITHIYSSHLERTQQTATLLGLNFPDVPITLEQRLLEVKVLKKFEGKSRDLDFYIPNAPSHEAESKQQIFDRMAAFLEQKVVQHNGQEVIAVSHGDPIALLYNFLVFEILEGEETNYPQFGSITSFVYHGLTLQQVWVRDKTVVPVQTARH